MKIRRVVLAVVSLFLLGAAHAETIGKPLNNRQITELVKGNTAEGIKTRSQIGYEYMTTTIPFATFFAADGKLVERASGGGDSSGVPAHGNWWAKGGKLCFEYRDSLRDTGKKCRTIIPQGDGAYELQTGKGRHTHTWNRVLKGNPLELSP